MHKYIFILTLLVLPASANASEDQWYLGEWKIKEAHFPGITAMTEREAEMWIGENIIYSRNFANFNDEDCLDPVYETTHIYNDGLKFDSYTLASLGLNDFPIEMINVICDAGNRGLGSNLIRKNNNSGFTFWDGAFFFTTKSVN
ncbi:MAG: hypothetical protein ACQEW0_02125 [Pseudomonadota bacterium]